MQENKQEKSPIKGRILQYLKLKGVSKYAFYRDSGVSRGVLDQTSGITEENIARFLAYARDVSPSWLVTGEGEIFNTKNAEKGNKENVPEFVPKPKVQKKGTNAETETIKAEYVFQLRTDRLIDRQQIPIYDMEAVAGLVSLFTGDYSQQIVEFVETALIPKCDGGLRIVGDSMDPLLKSGDVVFYRRINDIPNNLLWGEMYLISFDMEGDEYITVKYLNKAKKKNHVILKSYNEHHAPLELHISRIRALALVKASLRVNSLK